MSQDVSDSKNNIRRENKIAPEYSVPDISSNCYFNEYQVEYGPNEKETEESKFQKFRLWLNDIGRLFKN